MLFEHLLDLVEEDAGLGLTGVFDFVLLLSLGTEEDFTLREKGSQDTGESRDTCTGPKERSPTCFWDEVQVYDCGDEVTDGITLLQDSAS